MRSPDRCRLSWIRRVWDSASSFLRRSIIFVCGFDVAVLLGAVGGTAAILHLLRVRADMGCRFAVDALIRKAAVIDALIESLALQNTVCMVGPCLAPTLKFFFAVPIAGLRAKPGTGKLARG